MSFKIKFILPVSPVLLGLAVFSASGVLPFPVCDRLLLCVPVHESQKGLKLSHFTQNSCAVSWK